MKVQQLVKKDGTLEKKILFSKKLGKFEYTDDDLITFVSPLLGFNHLMDFLFISSDELLPFSYLQSVQDPDVTFILVDVKVFFPDYAPNLHKRELKVLQIESESQLSIFGIVVVRDNPEAATVNLKAPVVINSEKKLAKQIILDDDNYKVKTPLFKQG
jgi:flagellar assembly factor FliW